MCSIFLRNSAFKEGRGISEIFGEFMEIFVIAGNFSPNFPFFYKISHWLPNVSPTQGVQLMGALNFKLGGKSKYPLGILNFYFFFSYAPGL